MMQLPPAARAYWLAVVIAGFCVVAAGDAGLATASHISAVSIGLTVLAFAVLAYIGERMSIPLVTFDETATHSIGSVVAIASVVVLPWYAAVLVMPVSIGLAQIHLPSVKALFNAANSTLAVAAAAIVLALIGKEQAMVANSADGILRALAVLVIVSAVYYIAGTAFVGTMISLISKERITHVYRSNHMKTLLQETTAIGLGLMLGACWLHMPAFAPLVALPVVMAYFSIETFVRIQLETQQSVLAMSESIDHRDPLTYNHSKRVAALSVALAQELGLSHEQVATIELSALVHDIGKIGIPSEILMKPGKLTPDERAQMELHPIIGFDMLRHYKQFRKGLGIVRWHHETWDGTGYPDRMPGPEVPLEARIVCVADAFEAMTADRPYRKAMSSDIAYSRLVQAAGTQFDPELVPVFRKACERIGELALEAEGSEAEGSGRAARPQLPPSRSVSDTTLVPQTVPSIYGRKGMLRRVPASATRCRGGGRLRVEADA